MLVILVQMSKTTGINGNPRQLLQRGEPPQRTGSPIPSLKFGITFLAILILPLMSAFISLPQAVLYSPRLIRLPLNVYLVPGLYLGILSSSNSLSDVIEPMAREKLEKK